MILCTAQFQKLYAYSTFLVSSLLLTLLSASLYVSKRGAYWDRLCRDVVGRLVVTRVHCGQKACSYYGTLIGNPTPGIQWYNFRPPGVTPNRGMGPPWGAFCQILCSLCGRKMSVFLSHAGILSKWLNTLSYFFHRKIATQSIFFPYQTV